MIKKNIVAITRDEAEFNSTVLTFEVPDNTFDLRTAVIKAVSEYCSTPEGKKIYEHNCDYFNWLDVANNVPNSICEKYGFRISDDDTEDILVDADVNLYDDSILEKHYTELFVKFLSMIDFRLDKDHAGYFVTDLQGANLGDIESERFQNAAEIAERMDIYIRDQIVDDLIAELDLDASYADDWNALVDAARKADAGNYTQETNVLDMICNHLDSVNLDY